ncbi:MAG: hypothetical protein HY512_01555 [Candidatus Aenigmarchaeota archaeon]|nr:hypothetical protein [Candidatus Aenigmarchaeota archaeon]
MKTRDFQLSRLTINHFDFLQNLYDNGVLDEKGVIDLATEGLKDIPKEARGVLYPVDLEVVGLVARHFRSGREKVAIYRDRKGQRYVVADFREP